MWFYRRSRFWYWFARELSQKYTRALILGLGLGLLTSAILIWLYPRTIGYQLRPTERIGLVGEFTPTTLPLSIQQQVSSGLTILDNRGLPAPALATRWEATDSGKTFIFYLARDQAWHSGKSVVAGDVNYNIKNVTFRAVDPHTLKASLLSPYGPFPTLVAKPIFQAGLRGFGPYRVAAIRLKGDKVQYLKLVPVRDPQALVREYRFYRTEAQAIEAFKLGEVDILEDMSSPMALAKWGHTRATSSVKLNRIVSLFFNLNDSLLKEKAFRQALAYALPPLSEERAFTPLSRASWAYSEKVRRYDPDMTQAKKLLTASKIATQSVELTISTFSQYIDVAQSIATSWNNLGLKTKVKVENAVDRGFQILLTAQDVPPDPDQYPFWHSTQTQTNITGYANVKIDKLLEDGRQELDLEKRKKIYADFQRYLVEDIPAIFLFYPKTYTLSRNPR
ncbi:MAG: ABC transporter substrate-binding protein [Patescibacteria group bacterium]